MHSLPRSWIVVALALAAAACKDSTAPRPTPREVQKVAGDDQRALPGEAIPSPLRVRVIGSDGRPLAGATVRWAVIGEHAATLNTTQSVTNSSGEAEVRVTVVRAIGLFEVTATAASAPPVVFTVEGLEPCLFENAPTLTLDTPRSGTLAPLDCFVNGWSSDVYRITLPVQKAISMRVRAPTFDPTVAFYHLSADWLVWLSDTVNATRDIRMKAIVPPGDYGVEATSAEPNVTGAYEISVSGVSESVEGCELVIALPNIRTSQQLAPTDCAFAEEPYTDVFVIILSGGEGVRITQSSSSFAPSLRLITFVGRIMAEAEGTTSEPATIEFTETGSLAGYYLEVSSTDAGMTGAYELVIDASPTAVARRAGATATGDGPTRRRRQDLRRISLPRIRPW